MTDLFVFLPIEQPKYFQFNFCDYPHGTLQKHMLNLVARMQQHNPNVQPPYFVIAKNSQIFGTGSDLFFIRVDSPDSPSGLVGSVVKYRGINDIIDSSTPAGFAAALHQDLSLPQSPFVSHCPITAIVNFASDNPFIQDTLLILQREYQYDLRQVVI